MILSTNLIANASSDALLGGLLFMMISDAIGNMIDQTPDRYANKRIVIILMRNGASFAHISGKKLYR